MRLRGGAPKEKKSKKQKQQEKEAELARLAEEQRLEEERLAKEQAEEEARMAKELKERQDAEAALLKELDERLDEQTGANAGMYADRAVVLEKETIAAFAGQEWAVFIACDPLPDFQREADVNTFLTEWGEKPRFGADPESMEATFADCTLCTDLIAALRLESVYAAARKKAKQAEWQHEIQLRLKEEMQKKIDGATADFLGRAEEFANQKTLQCMTCVPSRGCRFGLWVNLAKNPRIKAIDYAELEISSELPKALALASIAVRVVHYDADTQSAFASPDALAASEWMTLGGTLDVDLLNLPPASKKVKGWTMRLVSAMTNSVVRMPYPMPNADGSLPPPGTAPALRISYNLPAHVIMPPVVDAVGYWVDSTQRWEQEAVSSVEWAPETRTVSFCTTHLASLSLLQRTHLELPYKNWIFSPSSPSSGALYLRTQRYELHIAISAKGCTLRAPKLPELKGLLGEPMAASQLLLKLRACGINLLPRDVDAAKLAKITPKDAELEATLHMALVPLIPRYQLAPSRWNQSRGPLKCTVRLSPAEPTFDADDEEAPPPADPYEASVADWPCLEVAKKRAMLISALDADATCNEAPYKGGVAHSTPLECLKGDDPEVVETLRTSSHLYQDTVRQLLDSLRLFSFTA